RPPLRLSPTCIAHGSALLGLYFVVKALSYGLDRFLLLYGDNDVVVGAGYTDVHVRLPVLWFLIVVAGLSAIASWANVMRWRSCGRLCCRPTRQPDGPCNCGSRTAMA